MQKKEKWENNESCAMTKWGFFRGWKVGNYFKIINVINLLIG